MNKFIVIGDIHDSKYWKKIISNNDYNHIVFLGDYLDLYSVSEDNDLLENFNEIIKLKIDNPNNVTLILGNHDLHYFSSHVTPCSRYNKNIANSVKETFNYHTLIPHYLIKIFVYPIINPLILKKYSADLFICQYSPILVSPQQLKVTNIGYEYKSNNKIENSHSFWWHILCYR